MIESKVQQDGLSAYKDGTGGEVTLTKLGGLYTVGFGEYASLGGRVYCANIGSATSPATFGAGSIDTTEPDGLIDVPLGTTIVPLEIRVKIEAYGTNAIFELMAAVGTGGVAGTDTDVTPTNLFSSAPRTTSCTVAGQGDADATYMTTNVSEFWRDGLMKAVTTATADDDSPMPPQTFVWNAKEKGFFPVLKGASELMVFAAGQATTGFITFIWAEFDTASFTDL